MLVYRKNIQVEFVKIFWSKVKFATRLIAIVISEFVELTQWTCLSFVAKSSSCLGQWCSATFLFYLFLLFLALSHHAHRIIQYIQYVLLYVMMTHATDFTSGAKYTKCSVGYNMRILLSFFLCPSLYYVVVAKFLSQWHKK